MDTPRGPVPVRELRVGDLVRSVDATGAPIVVAVRELARRPVLGPHEVLTVSLEDGRQVVASGGHPLADGRALAALSQGATLEGTRVLRVTRTPFQDDATWDLRVSGPTGVYFVGGIALRSTLEPRRTSSPGGPSSPASSR